MAVNRITAPHERLFVKALAKAVAKYFRDPKNQEEFKAWYLEKYGVPYPKEFPKPINESEEELCEITAITATAST